MYLCGIPKVKVLGTDEDWEKFCDNTKTIAKIIPEFENYLTGVRLKIYSLRNDTLDFSQMFRLDRCGSGSQAEVAGWITDFYIEQPRVTYPENFISCISKIDYHNYNDGQDYRMYAGLFTSTIENDYLIPDFGNVYFRKMAVESKDDNTVTLNVATKTVKGGYVKIQDIDTSEIIKK